MKDIKISIIRFIAMIFIVSCHIFQGLDLELAVWFNVGVQIFLTISGYLYGNKKIMNPLSWYIQQYFKIMIPYWILISILLMTITWIHPEVYSFKTVIMSYIGIAGFHTLPNIAHTWFITYILICYFITPLLQKLDLANKKYSFLRFVVSMIMLIIIIQPLYLIKIVPQYLICYILGYYISSRKNYMKNDYKVEEKNIIIILSTLCLVLLPIRLYMQYGIQFDSHVLEMLRTAFIDFHHSLLGISIFFFLYYFMSNLDLQYNWMITFSDKYSYDIYLVHQLVILNTFSLLHLTDLLLINIISIIFAILILALVLHFISAYPMKQFKKIQK